VPTNSRNVPESLKIMPRTAEESVKNLTSLTSRQRESLIFWYNLTATRDPISSILGMEILHLGATLVFLLEAYTPLAHPPTPISGRPQRNWLPLIHLRK
jgi:hypothetical protein